MKKIIILFVLFLSACRQQPIAVYERVGSESVSPHYVFKCWIKDGRYNVLGKPYEGLVYIANTDYSCAGDARIGDLK